jgi:hypothetical protein
VALSVDQLRNGISYWRGTDWPQDFHNAHYRHDLTAVQANGAFNREWWDRFIRVLYDWRATRPCSFAFLTARAQERFAALSQSWAAGVAPHLDNDIAGLEWHQVAAFPLVVAEIKPLKFPSPVFTAKFCHFLAPRIFPVFDNEAMRNRFQTYEECFSLARAEWLATDTAVQDELATLFAEEVGAPLFSGFPMKCKLIELCIIGRRGHG